MYRSWEEKIEHTKDVVMEMLCYNTGRHLLDSGGAYGRHWERNSKHVAEEGRAYFDNRPAVIISGEEYGAEISVDLYHFLTENFCAEPDINAAFDKFNGLPKWAEEPWEDVLEAFCDFCGLKVTYSAYTYNEDNILNQDYIWYATKALDDQDFWEHNQKRLAEEYAERGEEFEREEYDGEPVAGRPDVQLYSDEGGPFIIRSHNGCDARGGFSKPYFFSPRNDIEEYIPTAAVHFSCTGVPETDEHKYQIAFDIGIEEVEEDEHGFTYTPGYYPFELWSGGQVKLEFVSAQQLRKEMKEHGEEDEAIELERGVHVLIDGDTAYCPWCGAKLEAYIYAH